MSLKQATNLKTMEKIMVGRWVYIDLPDVDLENVKAKIDTGAYRSSLHCDFVEEYRDNGDTYLSIITTDLSGRPMTDHATTVRLLNKTTVRSSNGIMQERPIVNLSVRLAGNLYKAEFTLTNRQDMKFPILLGRKFLRNKFVVDVSLDDPSEE